MVYEQKSSIAMVAVSATRASSIAADIAADVIVTDWREGVNQTVTLHAEKQLCRFDEVTSSDA